MNFEEFQQEFPFFAKTTELFVRVLTRWREFQWIPEWPVFGPKQPALGMPGLTDLCRSTARILVGLRWATKLWSRDFQKQRAGLLRNATACGSD